MKQPRFEEDCRIPFKLSCIYRRGSSKGAEINLKNNYILQIPIPSEVRYAFAAYLRWLKSEEGQKEIEKHINDNSFNLWK